ncbi:hypothetical protein FF38_06042 [Lucilia cuprina]|uniref:Uncharacterized protein n=1 Tax=Lucilia cuprina TaxID=7375 RepID=A0A0L0CLW9_LUCCU|nr:hypothetical protein FF38_06042 [Lucilia cuprina]
MPNIVIGSQCITLRKVKKSNRERKTEGYGMNLSTDTSILQLHMGDEYSSKSPSFDFTIYEQFLTSIAQVKWAHLSTTTQHTDAVLVAASAAASGLVVLAVLNVHIPVAVVVVADGCVVAIVVAVSAACVVLVRYTMNVTCTALLEDTKVVFTLIQISVD